jgi:3-deoxy-D-manno-octulosonic-acid transferase
VVVVSGRISDRSLPRYRWFGPWVASALARLSAIGARTEQDRERFVALGAAPDRVHVTGDLKFDPPVALDPFPELIAWLGDAPLVVAGSTHPGEEQILLTAQRAWEDAGQRAALILAPRHPDRAQEVVRIARRAGRRAALRSECGGAALAAGDVGVLDTLGELTALYARAAVAFVGGTLVPIGGHNLLEPAAVGTAAVYGSHLANVRHAAALLEAVGAGVRVGDAASLAAAISSALAGPVAARARGAAGRAALEVHRGSSERSAALIESAIAARSGARSA